MIIGIAIDDYKQSFYERELVKRELVFAVKPGVTHDMRIIQITTDDAESVRRLCRKLELTRPWKS